MYFTRAGTHAHRAVSLFPSYSLRRLVLLHQDACRDHGLNLASIGREDDSAVLRWLQERAGLLPAHLAEDLERIDELTDERGASTLLAVGRDAGLDLRSLGVDPVQVAVAAFLDHRPVFERAFGRRAIETLRGTTEFSGRPPATAPLFDASELEALAASLGREFDARGRSAHCRIEHTRDRERIVFTVARGALVKVDEAVHEEPAHRDLVCDSHQPVYFAESTVRYRPQRRDTVVYDGRAGTLRVQAGDAATVRAYLSGFGALLFRDPAWFGDDPVVNLEPLTRLGPAVEVPTPGIRAVRVVGLIVRDDSEEWGSGTFAIDSEDIWSYQQKRLKGGLAHGELLEVIFRVWCEGRSQPAVVKVRTPRKVEWGRVGEELFRPFLEAHGFYAVRAARMAV